MLLVPHSATPFWRTDCWATVAGSTLGTTFNSGGSNVEGTWTQMFSAATVANDVYGFYIYIGNVSSSAAARQTLLDIGIDPAGGTSYTAIITDFVVGGPSGTSSQGSREHFFPLFIKAGSSIAVRSQTADASGSLRVGIRLYGQVTRPEGIRVGTFTETIGAVASSKGVSFTPGGSGAWGSRVSIGTTVRDLWWWQIGVQVDNTAMNAEAIDFELSVGDGTTFQVISSNRMQLTTSEVANPVSHTNLNPFEAYMPLKAGSTLYVRGAGSAATPTTGFNCNVIGVGG